MPPCALASRCGWLKTYGTFRLSIPMPNFQMLQITPSVRMEYMTIMETIFLWQKHTQTTKLTAFYTTTGQSCRDGRPAIQIPVVCRVFVRRDGMFQAKQSLNS